MVGVFGDAQAAAAQQARFGSAQGYNNNNISKWGEASGELA